MDKIKLRRMRAKREGRECASPAGALGCGPRGGGHIRWGPEGRVCFLTDATRFQAEQRAQGEPLRDTLGRKHPPAPQGGGAQEGPERPTACAAAGPWTGTPARWPLPSSPLGGAAITQGPPNAPPLQAAPDARPRSGRERGPARPAGPPPGPNPPLTWRRAGRPREPALQRGQGLGGAWGRGVP